MTYEEHVTRLAGGMEAAMHLILCLREVYPPGAYASRTHCVHCGPLDAATGGTATYSTFNTTHPGLRAYFARVREALQAQLSHQDVAAVALLLHLPRTGRVLERYVFRLAYAWPRAPPPHERTIPVENAWSVADFEYRFAGLMGKLTALLATLSPLPHAALTAGALGGEHKAVDGEEVSCAVVLQLQDPSARPSAHDAGARPDPHQPHEGGWVPLDPVLTRSLPRPELPESHGTAGPSASSSGLARARAAEIVPVQSLASGVIDMAFYVEDYKVAKTHARRHANRRQDV